MKRMWLASLVTVALLAGCSFEERVQFADGTETVVSAWQDRYIVINYWAEWCAPCRHEIPELNELHAAGEVVVLGVNYDGVGGDKLTSLIGELGIQYPVLVVDPQESYGYDRAETLPMTVVLNPLREVQRVLIGPQTKTSIEAAILAN